MQDVEEEVLMTEPEQENQDPPSAKEDEDVKSVLVTTEFSHHMGEEVVEMAPDQLDVEALSKQEAVYVKLTEEVDVESDIYYPITCGETKALLVWKKFVCPGINIKCIQLNDQLVSPKEFVCLAGKSTLKDWKRAIRLNGTMLRKIMDSGELEFYQHAQVCSNTCRSTKIDVVGIKLSAISQQSADFIAVTPSSTLLNGQSPSFSDAEESSEWVTAIGEDAVVFWCGVKQAGLLDEVVDDFRSELKQLLSGLRGRVSEPPLLLKDVSLLDSVVQNFGMLELVKKVLARHKSQMDHYREQYTQSLAALEQQCDEHRRRAMDLKSKAQHLDHVLMTLSPAPSPPAPKHPRLSRCPAPPAAPPPPQITLSLSQLAGLGKVFSVGGGPPVAGGPQGGYSVLAPGGAAPGEQPLCYPSNLTLLSAGAGGPEGGAVTFLKVLGPQYQLVALPPPLGGALQGVGGALQGVGGALQGVGGALQGVGGALQGVGVVQGVAQAAAPPRAPGGGVALHTQGAAPAEAEVGGAADLQKVAVETESEEDQES